MFLFYVPFAVIVEIRLNVWNTNPIFFSFNLERNSSSDFELISVLRIWSCPSNSESNVPKILSRVVFPPPDGPLIIINSPRLIG